MPSMMSRIGRSVANLVPSHWSVGVGRIRHSVPAPKRPRQSEPSQVSDGAPRRRPIPRARAG